MEQARKALLEFVEQMNIVKSIIEETEQKVIEMLNELDLRMTDAVEKIDSTFKRLQKSIESCRQCLTMAVLNSVNAVKEKVHSRRNSIVNAKGEVMFGQMAAQLILEKTKDKKSPPEETLIKLRDKLHLLFSNFDLDSSLEVGMEISDNAVITVEEGVIANLETEINKLGWVTEVEVSEHFTKNITASESQNKQDTDLQQKIDHEIKMREGTIKLLAASKHPSQRLEAARSLLCSNTRIIAYMTELQRRKTQEVLGQTQSTEGNQLPCRAQVCISDIRIPLMWKDTDHFKNKGDFCQYAVFCLLKVGTEIYDTSMITDVDRRVTDITFDDVLLFQEVPHDFELKFEVYCHKLHEEFSAANTPKKICKIITDISGSVGRSVGKRLSGLNDADVIGSMILGPRFELVAKGTLSLQDVDDSVRTYDLELEKNSEGSVHELPLFGHYCCRVAAVPSCLVRPVVPGFLNVQLQPKNDLTMALWRHYFKKWHSDYLTKTYFVPRVFITRVQFDMTKVAGQSVFVPCCIPGEKLPSDQCIANKQLMRIQENQTREDLALQNFLSCLQQFAKHKREVMFVISQLTFSDYLGEPCFAATAKRFLRTENIEGKYATGDFNILLIHRKYGILIGQIRSVNSEKIPQDQICQLIANKVKNAISQFEKSRVVLRKLTEDLESRILIRKFLILPYVECIEFKRALKYGDLEKELAECLEAENEQQVIGRCLFRENLPSPDSPWDVQQFQEWWSICVSDTDDRFMTNAIYLDILARFCGPATTVSANYITSPRIAVRTDGDGVSLLGKRMMSLVLTPRQVELILGNQNKVILTGPPGVGKSVMLGLIALKWLESKHIVDIVSTGFQSLAASHMLEHMIKSCEQEDSKKSGTVNIWKYSFDDNNLNKSEVDKAIDDLKAGRSLELFVICDEFWTAGRYFHRYNQFISQLSQSFSNVHIWAASPYHAESTPELLKEEMTIPLRRPLTVIREIEKEVNMLTLKQINVLPYKKNPISACGGMDVIHVIHQPPRHSTDQPLDCAECGKCIAHILIELGVGLTDGRVNKSNSNPDTSSASNKSSSRVNMPPPLEYHDVFVLTHADMHDDKENATKFVRSLRDARIPVHVIRKGHESVDIPEVAVGKNNKVTIASYENVIGLERKIVVWLPHRKYVDKNNDIARFHAVSRCTAQLVEISP